MIVESYEDVIVLSGALRSNFWDTIHTAISLTLKRHPTGVIIDCSGLTEATPEGAETFHDAMDFIKEHDARIIVAAVPAPILEVLKTVPEVRSQLPIAASVEEARRSLDLLVEEPKKKKQAPPSTDEQVLVCLFGDDNDRAALHLGSKIADTLLARIVLVYVVLMPRDLPLQAPMPEDEELAAKAIDHGKAYLAERNINATARLERGRDLASAVQEVANEINTSHVVVPLSPDPVKMEANQKLVRSVLEKVADIVVFVRGAQ
ncbi:MAG: hypothetical protein M9921_11275 [Fimbriimonadaceae bacterium]|nr:hypothetical protein [Fimbriimonadaceae bacterium]